MPTKPNKGSNTETKFNSFQCIDEEVELLTVLEFSEKLKIARSTVFNWLKTEKLELGVHYFKIDRVIRIRWPAALKALSAHEKNPKSPVAKNKTPTRNKSAIDLNYN